MYYVVKGIARVDGEFRGEEKDLDGIYCQEDFAEYLDEASHMGILSGYLEFKWEAPHLYSITRYECTRELTEIEKKRLLCYTVGQWSDGIGENFEQRPVYDKHGNEAYISPWYYGQESLISQE